MNDFIHSTIQVIGLVSFFIGWPAVTYLFWTQNRCQDVAATWKIVTGVWLLMFVVQLMLLGQSVTIPVWILPKGQQVYQEKIQFASNFLAYAPPTLLAGWGLKSLSRWLFPPVAEEEIDQDSVF